MTGTALNDGDRETKSVTKEGVRKSKAPLSPLVKLEGTPPGKRFERGAFTRC